MTGAAAAGSKRKRIDKQKNPETDLLINLNNCSKSKNLSAAISLYDAAISASSSQNHTIRLSLHHFQTLLYICSSSSSNPCLRTLAIENGFRIFNHMVSLGISPNEASITSIARLAAAKGDGDYAFKVVKEMKGSLPRLRTFAPALFCFCGKGEAEKAYEVEEQMSLVGVALEEAEIAALLKVSAFVGNDERVYMYLHKLRESVRFVKEETVEAIELWFCSDKAIESGGSKSEFGVGLVKDAVFRNGGGWHGLGWIGEGKWVVKRGNVEEGGRCLECGEQLACVDIDEAETGRFASSVAALALEREVKANFSEFQGWLEKHSDYQAIVDGANIGLYQQNFADGGFSVPQLEAVVKELYHRSGNKWPLVVLHKKRVQALLENPSHRKLVEEWINNGVLYTTPHGSNDDWYWLYAAVKLRCLLVTNDEMRDHIFELLGSSFFQKWQERHQVRYTFVKGSLKLQMPPPYSAVIQESVRGSWHVPIAYDSNDESVRSWLCITRPSSRSSEVHEKQTSSNGKYLLDCSATGDNECRVSEDHIPDSK